MRFLYTHKIKENIIPQPNLKIHEGKWHQRRHPTGSERQQMRQGIDQQCKQVPKIYMSVRFGAKRKLNTNPKI